MTGRTRGLQERAPVGCAVCNRVANSGKGKRMKQRQSERGRKRFTDWRTMREPQSDFGAAGYERKSAKKGLMSLGLRAQGLGFRVSNQCQTLNLRDDS